MRKAMMFLSAGFLAFALSAAPQAKPRARDLGIPFEGTPGPLNAITDVAGVEVGHTTIISGEGALQVGRGPVRTGVTAVWPRGKNSADPVFAGWFSLNGNGEMTGTAWVEESGFLEGPVAITNTHSVGAVRDAIIKWQVRNGRMFQPWSLPVVAETYDGRLNDINGFHVTEQHTFDALQNASGGRVTEGNAGGGTGMMCHEFKGGIGTASREVRLGARPYRVGVLVQCNYGLRRQLRIAGAPVGEDLRDAAVRSPGDEELGSIIIVVATDAPLLPHQLKRIARRAALGLARVGSTSGNGSGDLFLAFSTANAGAAGSRGEHSVQALPNGQISPLFEATVHAVEEAIVNAMVAAETMTGVDGRTVQALPHAAVQELLRKYGRLGK